MCIYLLACGASQTQFNVLNYIRFALGYSAAIWTIKELGQERLIEIVGLIGWQAFMIIWDNLNIAFWVAGQHKESKDQFDNGTTVTLIPLYDVEFGGLPLDPKPPPDNDDQSLISTMRIYFQAGSKSESSKLNSSGTLKIFSLMCVPIFAINLRTK